MKHVYVYFHMVIQEIVNNVNEPEHMKTVPSEYLGETAHPQSH